MRAGEQSRGIAIVSVLVMMVIMTMLVTSLMILARNQALVSRSAYDREAALFTMEAAVAQTQSRLEVDPSWSADLVDQVMETRGSYTIVWNTSGSGYQPHQSVNNMMNPSYGDSHRGPNSVPPYSALLVVTAKVGVHERVGEFFLLRSGTVATSRPIVASGDIRMRGNVRVDGIKSLATGVPVAGGIHSGTDSGSSGQVTWSQLVPTDEATVTGKVTTVNPAAGAIDFGSDPSVYFVASQSTGEKAQDVRPVDIPLTISMKNGETAYPTGATTLGNDEFYHNGDLVINGDLKLGDSALYVNGNLRVNGSISGKGSVYVNGDTIFEGDSTISAVDEQHVGLFSQGSVRLSGFDGSAYLDDMSDPNSPNYDAEIAVWWPEAKSTLADLQADLQTYSSVGDVDQPRLASMLQKLGEDMPMVTPYGDPNGDINVLGKISDKLALTASGPTETFLVDKLANLRMLYKMPGDTATALTDFQASGDPIGLVYASAVEGHNGLWKAGASLVQQTEFDKIGTSYFNGVVFTGGGFLAENEVNILGALMAINDSGGVTNFPDGTSVDWGDIRLETGTRLTYVEDYFDAQMLSTPGAGYVSVQAWASH